MLPGVLHALFADLPPMQPWLPSVERELDYEVTDTAPPLPSSPPHGFIAAPPRLIPGRRA
jgi:hypothetical protein